MATVTVLFVTVETGNQRPVPDDNLGMPVHTPARDQVADELRIDLPEAPPEPPACLMLARPGRRDVLARRSRLRAYGVRSLSGAGTGGY